MAIRLVALAAMLGTGCSALTLATPRERPAPPLRCKAESSAPTVDAVVGGLALLSGGAATIVDLRNPGEFQGFWTVYFGLPMLAIGTLYGLSATYGFVQTSRCRRFHRELGTPAGPGSTPR